MGTVAKNFPCGNEPGGRASQVSLRRLDFGSQRATKSATRPIVCDYVLARVSCVLPWWWWRRWCVRRSNMATWSSCQWPAALPAAAARSALPLSPTPRRRAMRIALALLTCARMCRVCCCSAVRPQYSHSAASQYGQCCCSAVRPATVRPAAVRPVVLAAKASRPSPRAL